MTMVKELLPNCVIKTRLRRVAAAGTAVGGMSMAAGVSMALGGVDPTTAVASLDGGLFLAVVAACVASGLGKRRGIDI
jgi:hypothetical protein